MNDNFPVPKLHCFFFLQPYCPNMLPTRFLFQQMGSTGYFRLSIPTFSLGKTSNWLHGICITLTYRESQLAFFTQKVNFHPVCRCRPSLMNHDSSQSSIPLCVLHAFPFLFSLNHILPLSSCWSQILTHCFSQKYMCCSPDRPDGLVRLSEHSIPFTVLSSPWG